LSRSENRHGECGARPIARQFRADEFSRRAAEHDVPGAGASGEDALIARYFRPLATDPGAFNLIDDAAILKPSRDDLVVKTDAIVEGRAFPARDPPDTIARKALRVNLSDLAVQGRDPRGLRADAGVACR